MYRSACFFVVKFLRLGTGDVGIAAADACRQQIYLCQRVKEAPTQNKVETLLTVALCLLPHNYCGERT